VIDNVEGILMSTSVHVHSENGETKSTISLDLVTEVKTLSGAAYANVVRVLMNNWRQGTSSTKTRGEIAFSNKKPWKQKGTGRARAGSARSPIWRSGGITFGPRPGFKKLKVNKQVRPGVFLNILADVLDEKRISCFDFSVVVDKGFASEAGKFLKKVGLEKERLTLFIGSDDIKSHMAFRNIANVTIAFFDQPNAFDLSSKGLWVFFKRDKEQFEGMIKQWS
jgi:large subunit ribosomal protein L4